MSGPGAGAPVTVAGEQYVTTSQAVDLLAGARVNAALVRSWVRAGRLRPVRDRRGDPLRVPAPGGRGREAVFRWRDVLEAEWTTRTARAGRPRGTR